MIHNLLFLTSLSAKDYKSGSSNITAFIVFITVLIIALILCMQLAKRNHLYEEKREKHYIRKTKTLEG